MKKYYWTIFGLWGEMRSDDKVWVSDGVHTGVAYPEDILLVCRIKKMK